MAKQTQRPRKVRGEIVADFAHALRNTRRARGLSQMRLAVKADIHISYLGRLERGESTPSIETVASIGGALGVSAAELLKPQGAATSPLPALRQQVRENVEALLREADAAALQALAVVTGAMGKAR